MKTRMIALFLALTLAFSMAACAVKPAEPVPEPEAAAPETVTPEPTLEPEPEPEPAPVLWDDLVGISMPTEDWKQHSATMQEQLEQIGYHVDLQFADDDPSVQISQIEDMIAKGAKVLIITAIDIDALDPVLDQAKEAGCSIIAYDNPIYSDAVDCYVAFSSFSVCAAQGKFIMDQLDLDNAGDKVYNIELVGGPPDYYNYVYVLYDGAMSVLQKYIDAGTLCVVSGQDDTESTATEGWCAEKTQERFENLLSTYYSDKQLDAVWCSNDATAQGVAAALENVYENDVYPILTGWGCEIDSVRNILDRKQAMSAFLDIRDLAAKAVEMADAIMKGIEPPKNGEYTSWDRKYSYPVFYVDPIICTEENVVDVMLDSGYYTREELGVAPEN